MNKVVSIQCFSLKSAISRDPLVLHFGTTLLIILRKYIRLDWGSIRSSLRYGLSTPYRLTIRNSARLFHIVLLNMGDMHLVLPALNLYTLNAGILISKF